MPKEGVTLRTLCDYVFMNLWDLPGSRKALSRRKQNDLLNGRFVHDVDPCVLMKGHEGEHVLTTMRRPDPPSDESND